MPSGKSDRKPTRKTTPFRVHDAQAGDLSQLPARRQLHAMFSRKLTTHVVLSNFEIGLVCPARPLCVHSFKRLLNSCDPIYTVLDVIGPMFYCLGHCKCRSVTSILFLFVYQSFSYIPGGPIKTSRTLRNFDGAYTLWSEISFGTFVDQYVLLLTYKFQ